MPRSDGRTHSRLLGLPCRITGEKARAYEKAIVPQLTLFPAGLLEKRRPNSPSPPFFALSARNARGTAENEPFSRNTLATSPETSLFPSPTQRIEWKRTLSELRCAACAAAFLFAAPPLLVCSLCWRPLTSRKPFCWRRCVSGSLSAPGNGAWRSKKPLRLRIGRRFLAGSAVRLTRSIGGLFSRERRMFHVKHSNKMARGAFAGETMLFARNGISGVLGDPWQCAFEKASALADRATVLAISARLYALRAASAAFSLKRGKCFT